MYISDHNFIYIFVSNVYFSMTNRFESQMRYNVPLTYSFDEWCELMGSEKIMNEILEHFGWCKAQLEIKRFESSAREKELLSLFLLSHNCNTRTAFI